MPQGLPVDNAMWVRTKEHPEEGRPDIPSCAS